MPESHESSHWAGERGRKWRTQLSAMESMLAPVTEPLLHALDLDAPCRIAEIGCGGGGTALEIFRRTPVGSVVHGYDVSADLIEVARDRAQSDSQSVGRNIGFEVADAGTATPARPYDRLASRFGIMFFDHPPEAFSNLARWLVPGGRIAFAAWGSPAENPWSTAARDATAEIVEVPRPDPEAPGPFRYGEAGKLAALLEQSGFVNLEVVDWRGTLPVCGGLPASEAATLALQAFSNFGELLAAAGEEAVNEARRRLTARYAQHLRHGIVEMSASVHIVTGGVAAN